MPDDRTSSGRDQPRPPRPPDRGREAPASRADPGRRAGKEAAIKAVSDLLALKKPALDKLASPAALRLPNFPGTPEATARRLENGPISRAKFDLPEANIPPLSISVPEAPRGDRSEVDDRPSGDTPPAGPTAGAWTGASRGLVPRTTSPPIDVGGPTRPIANGRLDPGESGGRADVEAAPDPRIATPHRDLPRGDTETGPPASGETWGRADGEARSTPAAPSGSVRIAGQVGVPGFSSPAPAGDPGLPLGSGIEGVAADGPRQLGGAARASVGPGVAGDAKADPGSIGVRASPAIGPRDLMAPSPVPSGDPGGASMDFGGSGHAMGLGLGLGGETSGSPSSQAEGGMDLSKTNELLEQLLEAVRSRRDAALPVGGPSVYSGR